MPVFPVDTSSGELFINSISLHTYAFCALDLRPLYAPARYRSDNVSIPGAHGKRAYPYWIDEATHDVPMFITGRLDKDGTPTSDPFEGYQATIDYLETNLLVPPTPPTATFAASITMPDATTKTADVQVLDFVYQPFDPNARFFQRAALTIKIPAGRFT